MRCRDLHELANPAYLSGFFSAVCSVLPCIAFPVVSEWCQYHSRIHITLSCTSSSLESELGKLCLMQLTGEPPPPSLIQTSTWRNVEGRAKGAPGLFSIYLVG
jgi:hypothetical protein